MPRTSTDPALRLNLLRGTLATLTDKKARKGMAYATARTLVEGANGRISLDAPEPSTAEIKAMEKAIMAEIRTVEEGDTMVLAATAAHMATRSGTSAVPGGGPDVFDPGKHPRDRLGKFIDVLGKLKHVEAVGLPDGVEVSRHAFGRGYTVVSGRPGSYQRQKFSDPKSAAIGALRLYDRNRKGLREATTAIPGVGASARAADVQKAAGSVRAPKSKGRGGKPSDNKPQGRDGKPEHKPNEKQQPNNQDFEKQHPRGRGGTWIKKGDGTGKEGPQQNVADLQKRLVQLGYGPGAPDGQFSHMTEQALQKFQADYGLTPTGEMDPATLATLQQPPPQTVLQTQNQNAQMGITGPAAGQVPGKGGAAGGAVGGAAGTAPGAVAGGAQAQQQQQPTEGQPGYNWRQQGNGQRGVVLASGQHMNVNGQQFDALKAKGKLSPATPTLQGDNPADGIGTAKGGQGGQNQGGAGRGTGGGSSGGGARQGAGKSGAKGNKKGAVLSPGAGMKGKADKSVKQMQKVLDDLGYDLGDAGVDGRFGPDTEKAVRKLQMRYGLDASGKIDHRTEKLLGRLVKRHNQPKKGIQSGDSMNLKHSTVDDAIVERARRIVESGAWVWNQNHGHYVERAHPRDRLGKWVLKPGAKRTSWHVIQDEFGMAMGDLEPVYKENWTKQLRQATEDRENATDGAAFAEARAREAYYRALIEAGGPQRRGRKGHPRPPKTHSASDFDSKHPRGPGGEFSLKGGKPYVSAASAEIKGHGPGWGDFNASTKDERHAVDDFGDAYNHPERPGMYGGDATGTFGDPTPNPFYVVPKSERKPGVNYSALDQSAAAARARYKRAIREGESLTEVFKLDEADGSVSWNSGVPTVSHGGKKGRAGIPGVGGAARGRGGRRVGTQRGHLQGQPASDFNAKHPRSTGGKFAAKGNDPMASGNSSQRSGDLHDLHQHKDQPTRRGYANPFHVPPGQENNPHYVSRYNKAAREINKPIHATSTLVGRKRLQQAVERLEEIRADSGGKPKSQRDCKMPHSAMAKKGKNKCPGCGANIGQVEKTVTEAADSLKKASTPEPFSKSKTSNWVAKGGGLPAYIQHIAHDIMEKRGKTESQAIAIAVGTVKRWARGGGNVDSGTRAAAQKALAEWEKLKAGAKG